MRRRLLSLLCVILIFGTVLSTPAFADNVTITTQDGMYSYFQTFSSSGYWTPIATPAHFISGTGDIAFCLQPAKQSPYGSS